MKKRILIFLLTVAMCIAAGCSKKEEPKKSNEASAPKVVEETKKSTKDKTASQTDYETEYSRILSDTYEIILNADSMEPQDGQLGIWEVALGAKDDAVNQISYLFKDINGDNVKELIIGCFETNEYSYTKNQILALYTLNNNKPLYVTEGRSRNAYSLMDDGKLFNTGSNGAAYSIFGTYYLGKNGKLICEDFYFSYPTDDYSEIEFYHNQTGIYDKTKSLILNLFEDEFFSIQEDFAKQTVSLKGTPFSKLSDSIKGNISKNKPTSVADGMTGTWVLVSGHTDGYEFTAEEAGLESELTVKKASGKLDASYWIQSDAKYESFDAEAIYRDMSLHEGCPNDEWCVEFVVKSGNFSDEDEFYATLIDDDTLLFQHFFPFDGTTGVSYMTYKRK